MTNSHVVCTLSFQELDLSAEALLLNDSSRENEWQRQVEVALHRKGRYYKVMTILYTGVSVTMATHIFATWSCWELMKKGAPFDV